MALARLDKPAVVLYSGPMRAGRWRGAPVTIQDVWEAVGAVRARRACRARSSTTLERTACPGPGTCAGHFTANTMAVALECLGVAASGDGLVAADDLERRRPRPRRAPGGWRSRSRAAGRRRAAFLDRRALLNAMAGIAASGGSTNGVLHLLAIAREAGVALDARRPHRPRRRARRSSPTSRPAGRYVGEDLQAPAATASSSPS